MYHPPMSIVPLSLANGKHASFVVVAGADLGLGRLGDASGSSCSVLFFFMFLSMLSASAAMQQSGLCNDAGHRGGHSGDDDDRGDDRNTSKCPKRKEAERSECGVCGRPSAKTLRGVRPALALGYNAGALYLVCVPAGRGRLCRVYVGAKRKRVLKRKRVFKQ